MDHLDRIVKMLSAEPLEERMAAAIVLGELGVKSPPVIDGLLGLALGEVPVLQQKSLDALAKLGPKKVAPKLFPLLLAHDKQVQQAAHRAIAAIGEEIVPAIKAKMATAGAEERRALDAVLAELGGKEAFSTLLASLTASDAQAAKAAAMAVRTQIKGADAKQKKAYLAETERFLKQQEKTGGAPAAVAAALQILGYLEDEKTIETLVHYASDEKAAPSVRQEAIIALRFPLQKKIAVKEVIGALIDAAAAEDRMLAQTALMTLGGLEITSAQAQRMEKLLHHPEIDRARFAIEQLGRQQGADAGKLLVGVLATGDKKRAELAANALHDNLDAVPFLTKALLEATDADRAWQIRNVLRPFAKKIGAAAKKQILEEAIEGLAQHSPGWEALLGVARDADPAGTAEALRGLITKLKKAKKLEQVLPVLGILGRSEHATPEDLYALTALELAKSQKDLRPTARAADECLKLIDKLVKLGFDVSTALKKDKSLDLEALYYVGFHFIEDDHALGQELLEEVVKKGGRTKLAKMAKNKLALAA
jgi:hypothetical protein